MAGGLFPTRMANGAEKIPVRLYYAASGDSGAIFIGDPVIKVTDAANSSVITTAVGRHKVGSLNKVTKATMGDGNAITGVVVGIEPVITDLTVNYRKASTEMVVMVADSPDTLFSVPSETAITNAIGKNCVFKDGGGSTSTGKSGVVINNTSDAPAADSSNQAVIVGLVLQHGNDLTDANCLYEVKITNHTEAQQNLPIGI